MVEHEDETIRRLSQAIRDGVIDQSALEDTEVYHDHWCPKAIDQDVGVCVCSPEIRIKTFGPLGDPMYLFLLADGTLTSVEPLRSMTSFNN